MIVNAAAESHVEKSIEEGASEFVTTNVEGTQILLDAIRRTPVERFILISSSEVYGTAEYAPMDEEHPLNPRSPYAATKAGGDRLAYSYYVTYGLPIVIVRPFNNYGPRQHPEKVIPRFITQALTGEPLTIHGDGHASRDWLYVDDDAEAIEAIIAADIDELAGEVVNVATGIDISVRDVADSVLAAVGADVEKVFVDERLGQVDRHIGSTDKLAAADRLARKDELRARPRADRRLVPRERGLVEGAPHSRQRLLVLGAGPAQIGLLRAARERDLFVIAVDRDPAASGFAYADKRALVSTEDEPGIDRLARAESVDGIVSPGADWPARSRGAHCGAARPAASDRRRDRGARDHEVATAGALRRGRRPPAAAARRACPALRRQGARPSGTARADPRPNRSRAAGRDRGGARSVPERHLHRRGVRRRSRGDGERGLRRRRLPAAGRDRPLDRRTTRVRGRARTRLALCCLATQAPIEAARAAAEALGIRNGPTYTQIRVGPERIRKSSSWLRGSAAATTRSSSRPRRASG